jgi:hypothetical protein
MPRVGTLKTPASGKNDAIRDRQSWMLNRLINGTTELDARRFFLDIMEQARLNPLTHQNTILEIDRFLKRLGR